MYLWSIYTFIVQLFYLLIFNGGIFRFIQVVQNHLNNMNMLLFQKNISPNRHTIWYDESGI